ncbi:hypothetical protein EG329_000530 [Mollisiaceae sp. DMI_Dod_QoI]|nr:hypothetical protein EG329_000530 [Helotiales sp. DMI_Dod_QoI]
MSRVRGVFPLFLATAFGIANGNVPNPASMTCETPRLTAVLGLWVFGPAFKERQENEEKAKKELTASNQIDGARVEELRTAEAAVSRVVATESALKPIERPSSWWTKLDVWSRGSNDTNDNRITKELGSAEDSKGTKEGT